MFKSLQKEEPDMSYALMQVSLVVLYSLVALLGTIGNTLVVKWFGEKNMRQKAGNKMVVVLAVNDFVSSIIVPLLRIAYVIRLNHFSEIVVLRATLCHFGAGVMETFLIATSWLLVAISVDRLRLVSIHAM